MEESDEDDECVSTPLDVLKFNIHILVFLIFFILMVVWIVIFLCTLIFMKSFEL